MKVWGEPPPQRRSRRQDRLIRPLGDPPWLGVPSPVDPGPFEPEPGGLVEDEALAAVPAPEP